MPLDSAVATRTQPGANPVAAARQTNLLQRFQYGLFGLPLQLVALPVYVVVPKFYADKFGLSLALIGAVLLASRCFDALSDPLYGAWIDRIKPTGGYRRPLWVATPLLGLGFAALFNPPTALTQWGTAALLGWLLVTLLIVYAGYSIATIAYQAWGSELADDAVGLARIAALREGCGLVGVVLAAALPQQLGMAGLTEVFLVALAGSAWLLLHRAPRPRPVLQVCRPSQRSGTLLSTAFQPFLVPFRVPAFRQLLGVFVANGIASAIPATLVLFFIRDVLGLERQSGLILVVYFVAAAASMPAWIALTRRIGLARAWLISMGLSVASFAWVATLAHGALLGFLVVSVGSGAALGADLAMPSALLAGVIHAAGHTGRREGAYFGVWNLATKLNLALAAGLILPLLAPLGYRPEALTEQGKTVLTVVYCLLPCLLKLAAAYLLWRAPGLTRQPRS